MSLSLKLFFPLSTFWVHFRMPSLEFVLCSLNWGLNVQNVFVYEASCSQNLGPKRVFHSMLEGAQRPLSVFQVSSDLMLLS